LFAGRQEIDLSELVSAMFAWLHRRGARKEAEAPLDQKAGISDLPIDPALKRSLDALGKTVSEHSREKPEKPKTARSAEVVQLPLWPEVRRGVPNPVLRGALFAAVQGKGRRYMKREILASQRGIEIRFTGMQLDQSDLDVWEQALHLARQHPLGTRCDFTGRGFLKALGRRTSGRDHEWLKDVFARLGGVLVEITHGRTTYGGSLLEFIRDEDTGRCVLGINPNIAALYTAGRWTAMDWEQRRKLQRKPLALWLHGFYASHAEPYPLSVEYLRKLSGSRTKQLKHFKQNLVRALRDLEAVGATKSFEIENSLVYVEPVPSGSQRKHLGRRELRESGG
jgi:hypothetical protein